MPEKRGVPIQDHSHLDQKYFIDENVYNCPFCNRRNVAYRVEGKRLFDWNADKACHIYFVRCSSCRNSSMHLSFVELPLSHAFSGPSGSYYKFVKEAAGWGDDWIYGLDDYFFYSVPTSFFVLDQRVPRILRELLTEAEGCLKSNFLTGASACARKLIYELAVLEKATGDNYDERIKSLKSLKPDVETEFFDTLLTIQQVTSTKVHEQAFDGWNAKHLRVILASLKEILYEMYVVPALRSDRRQAILSLKQELTSPSTTPPEAASTSTPITGTRSLLGEAQERDE